jgi:phage/plasmid-associated DNA primase
MATESTTLEQTYTDLDTKNWFRTLLGEGAQGQVKDVGDAENLNLSKVEDHLPRTELLGAIAIQSRFKNRLTYVAKTDTWYLWDGRVHTPCVGDGAALKVTTQLFFAVSNALSVVKAKIELQAAHMKASGIQNADAEAKKILKKWDTEWRDHRNFRDDLTKDRVQRSVTAQLKRLLDVGNDHYESNPDSDDRRYFVIENGVYDMEAVRKDRRFDLLPHDAARHVYRMWNLSEYVGAEAPDLYHFLETSIADASQARFFSKSVALACMGAPTTTRTILSLQGARHSGKSMINRVLNKMVARDTFVVEPDRAAVVDRAAKKSHARYPMREARYLAFAEIVDELDREFILKYTGGDKYDVEQKYVAADQVYPQGIMFFVSNHPLNVDKTDEAMFERVAPINFPRSFDGLENPVDVDLEQKIVAAGSGFLEWMKASYLAYLAEGLDKSDSMEALKLAEREDEYSVFQFVKDRMESGLLKEDREAEAKDCISVVELFVSYKNWYVEMDVPQSKRLKRKDFGNEISRVYPKVQYQRVHFAGLALVHAYAGRI